jgi:nitroreductase
MEAYPAIVTKRDTRAYASTPIPDDLLHRILQAGRMAGSARNRQPVRLIVVRDAELKTELAACGQGTGHLPSCAVAIAIVLLPEGGEPGKPFEIFRGPFDAGRAAQNMMVTAWAEGIASCPVTLHDFDAAGKVFGLPEGHVVANMVALGYPAEAAEPRDSQPRLPFDEVVHWERW